MSASTATYQFSHMPSHEQDDSSYLFSYAKSMYEHTRKQMEAADKSARRRSANADNTNAHASLRTGHEHSTSTDSSSSASSRLE
ncbi:hypothetical protein EYC80_007996 [Monilinia laxa]|uniref:Uncharacterized protein n=1 Tax=Monilinia laxa TaxID=61186 RepID=A0A5N6JVG4_MONLA|nr:hypothetical protein EYC80_007996 [Monilinia laxa]